MEQTLPTIGNLMATLGAVIALLFVLQEKFVRPATNSKGLSKVITLRGLIILLILSLLYQLIDPTTVSIILANASLASLAAYVSLHYN